MSRRGSGLPGLQPTLGAHWLAVASLFASAPLSVARISTRNVIKKPQPSILSTPVLTGVWLHYPLFHSFLTVSFHSFTSTMKGRPEFPIIMIDPSLRNLGTHYISVTGLYRWVQDLKDWVCQISFDAEDLIDVPFVHEGAQYFFLST